MKKDFLDPDLLDLLTAADLPSAHKDRFVAQLYRLLDAGVDISEIEALLSDVLMKLPRLPGR